MKKILCLLLLAASAAPCFASNDYLSQTAGSVIGDTDVILFETTGGTLYKVPATAIKTYTAYSLPTATTSVLGGVKVDNSTITISGGVISAPYTYTLPPATTSVLGGVKVDNSTITISSGVISAPYTYTLPPATTSVLGGVKVDGTTVTISGGVLSIGSITSGAISDIGPLATITPTGTASSTTYLRGDNSWATLPSSGTVTSVAVSVPSFLTVSGSPVTSSGTLAITLSGTALPVANGGTGVTTSTGSGSVVLSTSPTLVTPALGTPASGVVTNLTGTGGFNTTGTAANLSGTPALPNGTTATTQTSSDNTTKLATTAFVQSVLPATHPSGTPTITASGGAGTSPSISITGSDVAGVISLTPGTSPGSSGLIFYVTYATAYGSIPNSVILTPANAAAATLSGTGSLYVDSGGRYLYRFEVSIGATAIPTGSSYKWQYAVSQQ